MNGYATHEISETYILYKVPGTIIIYRTAARAVYLHVYTHQVDVVCQRRLYSVYTDKSSVYILIPTEFQSHAILF